MNRSAQIIRTSIVGIVTNVLLAAFKALVGFLSSSIAIVMDAVNNGTISEERINQSVRRILKLKLK